MSLRAPCCCNPRVCSAPLRNRRRSRAGQVAWQLNLTAGAGSPLAAAGYNAIAVDNFMVGLEEHGGGGACGHFDRNGSWVQQYTGAGSTSLPTRRRADNNRCATPLLAVAGRVAPAAGRHTQMHARSQNARKQVTRLYPRTPAHAQPQSRPDGVCSGCGIHPSTMAVHLVGFFFCARACACRRSVGRRVEARPARLARKLLPRAAGHACCAPAAADPEHGPFVVRPGRVPLVRSRVIL